MSKALRELLRAHVTSFEALEILLLLKRQPHIRWSTDSVIREVRIPSDLAEAALHSLCAAHLAELKLETGRPCFRYAPADARLRSACDELAATLEERRADILSYLSTMAIERVRSGAIRAFSDAFLISGPIKRRN